MENNRKTAANNESDFGALKGAATAFLLSAVLLDYAPELAVVTWLISCFWVVNNSHKMSRGTKSFCFNF